MPASRLYNETRLLTFARPVDPAIVERCLNEIVRRHDALRTTFVHADGHLVQVIERESSIRVPVVDVADRRDFDTVARADGERTFATTYDAMISSGVWEWIHFKVARTALVSAWVSFSCLAIQSPRV